MTLLAGDACENGWHGVYCVDGAVEEIALGSNNLRGSLPSALGELDSLKTLCVHQPAITHPMATVI